MVQIAFLREAEKRFRVSNESVDKFTSANQTMEKTLDGDGDVDVDGDGDKELTMEEQKLFEEACKEGIGVPYRIYIKLSRKEKKVLYEARQKKKGDTNG
eukprot:15342210-Ditylum_brightwellii.AAC.1